MPAANPSDSNMRWIFLFASAVRNNRGRMGQVNDITQQLIALKPTVSATRSFAAIQLGKSKD
jgi:hypothetical protein